MSPSRINSTGHAASSPWSSGVRCALGPKITLDVRWATHGGRRFLSSWVAPWSSSSKHTSSSASRHARLSCPTPITAICSDRHQPRLSPGRRATARAPRVRSEPPPMASSQQARVARSTRTPPTAARPSSEQEDRTHTHLRQESTLSQHALCCPRSPDHNRTDCPGAVMRATWRTQNDAACPRTINV